MGKAAWVLCAAGVFVAASARAGAGDRISVRVSPQVAFAPADVNVRAMVEADPDNRSIQIVADSNEFYRSSEIQLDGAHAPRTSVFVFRDLPSGSYDLRAIVKGSRGEVLATTHTKLNVISQ